MYDLKDLVLPFIFLFGACQGFILTLIFGCSKRFRTRYNLFFALLLFAISVLNIDGAFQILGITSYLPSEEYFPYFLVNLVPVSIYFFSKFLTQREATFKGKDWFFFSPFLIDISYQTYQYIRYLRFGALSEKALQQFHFLLNLFELFAAIATLMALIYSIKSIQIYQEKLKNNFSAIEQKSLKWLSNVFMITLPLSVFWIINAISDINPIFYVESLAIVTWLGITGLIYWISYSMLLLPELLVPPSFSIPESTKVLKQLKLEEAEAQQIEKQLEAIIQQEQPYLNPKLTLNELAALVQISDKKLSIFLNQHLDINFHDFVNRHRIHAFKAKVKTENIANLSIVGLAQECGFKSKSSFYRAFQKHVGMTPSEYMKRNSP